MLAGGGQLLSLWRQRRQPAIGRIDNQRCARAGALHGREHRVVGAGDVELGPALHTLVAAQQRRSLLIQFGSLRLGKKFLVRKPGGALQGRIGFVGPNALQIGFAPGHFQRWRRSLSRRPWNGDDGADSDRGDRDRYHRACEPVTHDRLLPSLASLQRIRITLGSLYAVPGCGVRTPSLRKGELFQAPSMQQPRKAIVSFDAARLGINSVLLVVLPDEILLGGPWPRPHRRVFDRYSVFERGWPGARPAFDEVQVLACALKIGLRAEVRHVDHKRVALPAA